MSPVLRRLSPLPGPGAFVASLIAAAALAGAADEEELPQHFLIEGAVPSDRGNGIVLNLGSATLTPDSLELHVGFRNMGIDTVPSYGKLAPKDYHLGREESLSEITAKTLSPQLGMISPPGGTSPRLANAGIVVFPAPQSRERLLLRVSGFASIAFSLSEASRISPLARAERVSTATPLQNIVLRSNREGLDAIALHIGSVRLSETRFIVDLEFENTTKHSLLMNASGISGDDAYFVDANFQMQSPVEVSTAIRSTDPAAGRIWHGGTSRSGSISFDRSHPHAMRRILFSFPTYESLILTFDEEARAYVADVVPAVDPGRIGSQPPSSPNYFRELSKRMASASDSLRQREIIRYLDHFLPGSEARTGQANFVTGMNSVAAKDVVFHVLLEQSIKPTEGGRLEGVAVLFDYALELAGEKHRFRSLLTMGFAKGADGDWMIDDWKFEKQPPFWLAGLTQLESTDHFSIFVRPDALSPARLAAAGERLERAYRSLAANEGLQLGTSHIAFLVDRREDFRFLTQKDPLRYHGAAASTYVIERDEFVSLNRAMFINDSSLRDDSQGEELEMREKTLTHELVHLALAKDTRHFTPPWLAEGVAIYFAGQLSPGSRRALLETGGLSVLSLSALSRGELPGSQLSSQAALNFEYIYAGEAVAYLVRTYGAKRFFEYYRSFAGISPSQLDALALEQSLSSEGRQASIPRLMHQIALELTRRQFGVSLYDLDTVVRSHISLQDR